MNKRIIVDTNLWISFLITRKYQIFKKLIISNNITLIFSSESIAEFLDVVRRPHLQKLFPIEDIKILMAGFNAYGIRVEQTSNIKICRDEKDDFLLNLAIDGKADYLITGDKDLLILQKVENTLILTYKDFLTELGEV